MSVDSQEERSTNVPPQQDLSNRVTLTIVLVATLFPSG